MTRNDFGVISIPVDVHAQVKLLTECLLEIREWQRLKDYQMMNIAVREHAEIAEAIKQLTSGTA